MNDLIIGILDGNKNVGYSMIIPLILGYILIFWLIVSIWVFFDAKKRFQSWKIAILIAIGNLIFQIPFLLLFLLFRPLEDEYMGISEPQGGVNIPIVNFLGNDGIAMSLELRINNHKITPQNASEMKIDVSFDSKDEQKQLIDITNKAIQTIAEQQQPKVLKSPITKFRESFKKIFKTKVSEESKNDAVSVLNPDNSIKEEPNKESPLKKKKKKNRR